MSRFNLASPGLKLNWIDMVYNICVSDEAENVLESLLLLRKKTLVPWCKNIEEWLKVMSRWRSVFFLISHLRDGGRSIMLKALCLTARCITIGVLYNRAVM